VLPATLGYLAVAVPGLVLLIRTDTAAGIGLLVVGHLSAWAFTRWHRRKYFGHQVKQ
jgi:uncharacterized membrane protein YfcA